MTNKLLKSGYLEKQVLLVVCVLMRLVDFSQEMVPPLSRTAGERAQMVRGGGRSVRWIYFSQGYCQRGRLRVQHRQAALSVDHIGGYLLCSVSA